MKEHSPAADLAARLYVAFLVTGDGQTLLRSAEMGYAYAQYEMYKRERYPNPAAAREWLAMAAEGGVPAAIAALAASNALQRPVERPSASDLNSHGGEVPMDTLLSAETRELQRIEALVCRYYDSGYYASAMHYAALIPSPQHCSIGPVIGTMYYEGLGTEVDYVQAARFYSWSVADYMDYLGASARTLSLADCRRIAEAHHRRFVAARENTNINIMSP